MTDLGLAKNAFAPTLYKTIIATLAAQTKADRI